MFLLVPKWYLSHFLSSMQRCEPRWRSRTIDRTERKKSTRFGMRNTSFVLVFFSHWLTWRPQDPQPFAEFQVWVFFVLFLYFVVIAPIHFTILLTFQSVSLQVSAVLSTKEVGCWCRGTPGLACIRPLFFSSPFSLTYGGGGWGGGLIYYERQHKCKFSGKSPSSGHKTTLKQQWNG